MRKLIPLSTVIAIAEALAAGGAASTAAANATTTKITCKSTEYNPTPLQLSGVVVGFIKCAQPLGKGVISATYSATFDPTTGAGTATGRWTKWFLDGTVHGRYTQTFQFTCNTDATYTRRITWTGGTGAYTGVKGTASDHCSTTNGGATLTCTAAGEVTGLYPEPSRGEAARRGAADHRLLIRSASGGAHDAPARRSPSRSAGRRHHPLLLGTTGELAGVTLGRAQCASAQARRPRLLSGTLRPRGGVDRGSPESTKRQCSSPAGSCASPGRSRSDDDPGARSKRSRPALTRIVGARHAWILPMICSTPMPQLTGTPAGRWYPRTPRRPSRQRLPVCPAMQHLAPLTAGQRRPLALARLHADRKQESSSVSAVDQTASAGAEQPRLRRCNFRREPAGAVGLRRDLRCDDHRYPPTEPARPLPCAEATSSLSQKRIGHRTFRAAIEGDRHRRRRRLSCRRSYERWRACCLTLRVVRGRARDVQSTDPAGTTHWQRCPVTSCARAQPGRAVMRTGRVGAFVRRRCRTTIPCHGRKT